VKTALGMDCGLGLADGEPQALKATEMSQGWNKESTACPRQL
jgi:hypothetical protein